jgi:hypothetical protein
MMAVVDFNSLNISKPNMLLENINLTLLKAPNLDIPYVLDDAVSSVARLLNRAGLSTSISLNNIDQDRVNIIFGLQMPKRCASRSGKKNRKNIKYDYFQY